MAVRVQVPLAVRKKRAESHEFTQMSFCFFICMWRKGTYAGSPARGTKHKNREKVTVLAKTSKD